MAALTVQTMLRAGLAPAFTAVTASDTITVETGERTFLHVKNASGASINATLVAFITSVKIPGVGSVPMPNQVVAVPAGGERMIGPIPPAFVDASGNATVNFSAQASVTAAAIRVDQDSQ
jgi:hypothetical protein